jgi:hypothetical protein
MKERRLGERLEEERGSSIIEALLALFLLALVVSVGVQGFAYAEARSVAIAAAQDGVAAAASSGPSAGLGRARQVLAAGGGAASRLEPSITEDAATVTVTVQGEAPKLFPLSILLPAIRTSATLPLEQFPTYERAATP